MVHVCVCVVRVCDECECDQQSVRLCDERLCTRVRTCVCLCACVCVCVCVCVDENLLKQYNNCFNPIYNRVGYFDGIFQRDIGALYNDATGPRWHAMVLVCVCICVCVCVYV